MATKYRVRLEDGEPSEFLGLVQVLKLLRQKLQRHKGGEKYRFRTAGNPWGPLRSRTVTLAKAAWHLPRVKDGEYVAVKAVDEHVYTVVKTKVKDPVVSERPDTVTGEARPLLYYSGNPVDLSQGNVRIQAVARWAKANFPRVDCSGYVYTRTVSGTSIWSQHSRFVDGGNAIDLTIYVDTTYPKNGWNDEATWRLARGIVAEAKAGRLAVDQVICRDKQWKRSSGYVMESYGGVYHTHTHVTASPYQTGTPVDA